jgi:hypothetical protein
MNYKQLFIQNEEVQVQLNKYPHEKNLSLLVALVCTGADIMTEHRSITINTADNKVTWIQKRDSQEKIAVIELPFNLGHTCVDLITHISSPDCQVYTRKAKKIGNDFAVRLSPHSDFDVIICSPYNTGYVFYLALPKKIPATLTLNFNVHCLAHEVRKQMFKDAQPILNFLNRVRSSL